MGATLLPVGMLAPLVNADEVGCFLVKHHYEYIVQKLGLTTTIRLLPEKLQESTKFIKSEKLPK